MQPEGTATVDVIIVSHQDGPAASTDCDEEIARLLEEEELAEAPERTGAASSSAPGAAGTSSGAGAGSAAAGAEPGAPAPSAPPLPGGPASAWQQELREPPPPGAEAGGKAPADDEQLARSLHDQELRGLSQEQQDRLTRLPALLTDSPLVRTLSDKLLQSMSLVKLLPQVNSSIAAAAAAGEQEADPVRAGRARLEERLRLYCLVERRIKGDGNCQFRSLSDQLFRTPRLHGFVRERVCKQLATEPQRYSGFVPGGYQQYCADMARSGTWGDHVTLQAAADHFGLRIFVLASYHSSAVLWIDPQEQRSRRVLWLSFWAEVHYNSLYPESEPPPPLPDDKLLGSRRLHSLLFGPRFLV